MEDMELDPGFVQDPMMEQLGRILDSKSCEEAYSATGSNREYFKNFNQLDTVITDDGDTVTVTPETALKIREAVFMIPTQKRLDVLRYMQTTEGLQKVIEATQ